MLPCRACTAEAVAAALRHLEGHSWNHSADLSVADLVLGNLRTKVNAVLRQNGLVAENDFRSITRSWQWRGDPDAVDESSGCDGSV